MNKLVWETPDEINLVLAKRLVQIRKRKKITGRQLSELSGVSYGSVKRFEQTGQISLYSLTAIAMALGCEDEIKSLFTNVAYISLEEVVNAAR